MKNKSLFALAGVGLFAATSLSGQDHNEPILDLEAFIVEQTADSQPESLSPLGVRTDTLFGQNLSILDIPRGMTAITPETRDMLGIDSFDNLDRYGAGTQRVNYFGLAGTPFLRGSRAGVYFNGMLRAYQRNQMPMSFGSAEGLQLVKGPTPASLSTTLVGGFVNQEPKAPYYDKHRGSIEIGFGSRDTYHLEMDTGGPFMLGKYPAAYRLSYTGHRSDRYYNNVGHDFDSLYGSVKIKLNERQHLFFGGELYDYRSSEAPGNNRPTQQLIDSGDYVIGEPADITSPAWGGNAVRTLTEFPYTLLVNPALHSLAIPGDIARSRIDPGLLSNMIHLQDPAKLSEVYSLRPDSEIPSSFIGLKSQAQAALDQINIQPQDVYIYTEDYFTQGGTVLTEKIGRRNILADKRDNADAQNFIAFADLDTRLDGDRSWRLRFLTEGIESEKYSTYGYAMQTSQFVANSIAEWRQFVPKWNTHLAAGIDLRFVYGKMLQDFDSEPFSRRDLTRPTVSANSTITAGRQLAPDGQNLWSTFGGATQQSHLWQTATFFTGRTSFGERFDLYYGLRAEQAFYLTNMPAEVDRATAQDRADKHSRGDEFLYQLSLNPMLRLADGLNAYAALQIGKATAPTDGGTVAGPVSFTDVELYEVGLKGSLLDDKLYFSIAGYHWDQTTYSQRDNAANPLRAKGLELELTWSLTDKFTLLSSFTAQRVHLREDAIGFGAIPQDEQGWALNGGILNAGGPRNVRATNPDMIFAGVPELSAHLYAAWQLPMGFRVSGGPLWRDEYWNEMGRSIRIPSHVVWNAQLYFERGPFYARLHIDNLFDEEYWVALDPIFAAGTLVLPGEGRSWQVRVGYRF